jgi:hypothetical protein
MPQYPIPIYTLGFYQLAGGAHQKMGTIRSNFFWQGTENNFKYLMAKWKWSLNPPRVKDEYNWWNIGYTGLGLMG